LSYQQKMRTNFIASNSLDRHYSRKTGLAGSCRIFAGTIQQFVFPCLACNERRSGENGEVDMTLQARFSRGVRGLLVALKCGLIAFAMAAPGFCATPDGDSACFVNPICEQADPWIVQYRGKYLACFAEGNRGISVHVSDRLTHLGIKHVVWIAPSSGPASREIWAPELHRFGGRWYIYFAASDGQNRNHRAWVLASNRDDPLGPYSLHGPLYTGDDPGLSLLNRWAIDLTVYESGTNLYAIWSGWQGEKDVQYLFIAPMKDPLTMAAPRIRLCSNDDYLWERVNERLDSRGLNEAPEILQHAGRTFLIYSCSGSWQPTYKLGLLELRPGGNPLKPEDWTKHPEPAFQSTPRTFGVGHSSFVKSPDGSEDWLAYHAKTDRHEGWQRVVFLQPFTWDHSGAPYFGSPVDRGQPLPLPSGEGIQQVTGPRSFSFATEKDLEGWSYFGHHQMLEIIRDGWLHLGDVPPHLVNEFRSGEKLVLDGGRWTNFTAALAVTDLESRGQVGLLFRVSRPAVGCNAQAGYFAGIDLATNRLVLGFTDGEAWRELASRAIPTQLPARVELGISAREDSIEVNLLGKTQIHVIDRTFASGSVGVRVVDTDAAFSQLEIKPLEPATFGGRSSIPLTNGIAVGRMGAGSR
jgi:GH43 family beta-xylosidase